MKVIKRGSHNAQLEIEPVDVGIDQFNLCFVECPECIHNVYFSCQDVNKGFQYKAARLGQRIYTSRDDYPPQKGEEKECRLKPKKE
jgi:hypothetical protein